MHSPMNARPSDPVLMREWRWDSVEISMAILLVFAIVLGGASQQNAIFVAIVEMASLPLLVFAGGRLMGTTSALYIHRQALLLLCAVCATPLLQLIPLPPQIWQALPGRELMTLGLQLSGASPGWSPHSVAPDLTRSSALALLPPVAIFLAALVVPGRFQAKLLSGLLLAATAFVIIGTVQLVSGSDQFHPYRTTDSGQLTGLFANRNHLATLILITLPFAAVKAGTADREGGGGATRLVRWGSVTYVFAAMVALGVIGSRAGVVLALPAVGMGLVIAWAASGRGTPNKALAGAALAVVAGGTTFAAVALGPLMARFDVVPEGRFDGWRTVVAAAQQFLPLGSGIGSFDTVYRSVEPVERLTPLFLNHAHNEYLELWLEAGWIGVVLIIAFISWWGRRSWQAWADGLSPNRHNQRAASAAILILMLHSTVDYPLRTLALATVCALLAGLLEKGACDRALVSRTVAPREAGNL
jgi:O-antigen ligase